jgi:CheY-like chemotaxis protein
MAPAQQHPEPLSVVVIDDDADVLDTFATYFTSKPGIALSTFKSPVVALDKLKTQPADAIFCDFSMPDMDGIEFLREIRSRGSTAFFIICTGRHLTRVAIDALNGGGNYYLQKGVLMMDELPAILDMARHHRDSLSPAPASRPAAAASRPAGSPARSPAPARTTTPPPATVAESPFQSLIDNQFVPFCGFDRNGRIRYANRIYEKEISAESREGTGFFSAIPEDEYAEFATYLKSLTTQNPAIHLLHHIRSNGSLKLVLGNYRVFMDASGEITGYTAILTPMSGIISLSSLALHSLEEPRIQPEPRVQKVTMPPPESHVAVKKKRRTKDYFTELSDSVEHVRYPVFAIDTAGKVIAWNPAIAELTGIASSDMIGRGGYAYADVLVGEKRPMLVDYLAKTPHDLKLRKSLGITHDGDVYKSDPDTVRLRGKTVHLWSKGAGIYDAEGALIAAVQSIMVSTEQPAARKGRERHTEETYLGGISSIILKVTDSGMGGAIAGAIGSAVGGYGVYVTDRRLFVIHNPFLDARRSDSISFGEFILGELFGTNVDTRPRQMEELERHKVFEVWKKDIVKMELKKPKLLAGSLDITTGAGGKFRVYIDHVRAFDHLGEVLNLAYPGLLSVE